MNGGMGFRPNSSLKQTDISGVHLLDVMGFAASAIFRVGTIKPLCSGAHIGTDKPRRDIVAVELLAGIGGHMLEANFDFVQMHYSGKAIG